ncbi:MULTISPECIES: DUF6887 family protein [Nostoc]
MGIGNLFYDQNLNQMTNIELKRYISEHR